MSKFMGLFGGRGRVAQAAQDRADAVARERKLGLYVTEHESAATENASLRMSNRILMVTNSVTAACLAIALLVVGELVPSLRYYPVLVTFSDKAEQMVRIVPPTANVGSMNLIAESMVRQYIKFRYTVADPKETKDRWNQDMRLFSNNAVYGDFQNETKPIMPLLDTGSFTRTVVITNIRTRPFEPGLYTVEFDTVDHTNSGVLNTDKVDEARHWTAELRIALSPTSVPRSQAARNPFGFIVGGYVVSPRAA